MTIEELAKQTQELDERTIELNERCNKIFEKLTRQAGGLNAKVELSKKIGHYEVIVNEVLILVDRSEYEAIEKTL